MYLKNSTLALLSSLLYISIATGQEGAPVQVEAKLTEVAMTGSEENEQMFEDLPQASKWDSLWLVEVASRQEMFQEMQKVILNTTIEEESLEKLDT